MIRSVILHSALLCSMFLLTSPVFSQIQFKLQWLPDSLAWGIFATPDKDVSPSPYLIIGSGQVTLVADAGSKFFDLRSFSGTWEQNAFVGTPTENPGKDYISFGFVTADPPMEFVAGEETLLFTFKNRDGGCPDTLHLIGYDDPFNVIPNSANANPGNDISVLDPGQQVIYHFSDLYAPEAWNCHPGMEVPQGPFRHGYDKRRNKRAVNRP